MTWTEVKYEGYDFCIMSGKYQIRRKDERVALYYYAGSLGFHRIGWRDSVEDAMFSAWYLELQGKRENGQC